MDNWQTLLNRSYVPYSGQPGAAICIGESGTNYPGVRIENISFPLTIDEVQSALYHCISQGDIPKRILVQEDSSALRSFWAEEFEVEFIEEEKGTFESPELPEFVDSETREQQISQQLTLLKSRAQVAYSDFPVTALLTFEDTSQFITGVNIETSDWRLGLCAERVAISNAISLGLTEFHSIHIHTPKAEYCSPCGACRQVINEHLPQADAVMHQADGQITRLPAHHYLPYAFQAKSLVNQ